MKRVLITGSNRGIGLEFTRQYLESGWRVYATCRRPLEAQSLQTLATLHGGLSVHRLDITLQEDISSLCLDLKDIPLDILINTAGVDFQRGSDSIACIHYGNWLRTLEVNTLGTVRITEALLDNLGSTSDTGLVVVISGCAGDDAEMDEPGSMYCRSSRAALNVAMVSMSMTLRSRNVGVLLLHPGEVMSGMGLEKGISRRESVTGMRQVIEQFSMDLTGAFFQYDGSRLCGGR